jgi:hypothetical protein
MWAHSVSASQADPKEEYRNKILVVKPALFHIIKENRVDTIEPLLAECREPSFYDAIFANSVFSRTYGQVGRELFVKDCEKIAINLFKELVLKQKAN